MEKNAHFFLIYPPGLTELGLKELQQKWELGFGQHQLKIVEIEPGGILIEVPILAGFLLNHVLKTPTRILWRLTQFKARDFPKLYQKSAKVPWSQFLIGQIPRTEVAAHQSKLFDSRKIEKAIADGIQEYYRRQPIKKRYTQAMETAPPQVLPALYFRSLEDEITLSLDTTGERLHKRGEKLLTGLAPIRENLAALLLEAITADAPLPLGTRVLIDPMCGSGTFLQEAHNFFRASLSRDFSYQFTPPWLDSQFKKQLLDKLVNKENPFFTHYLGLDANAEVLKLARENCAKEAVIDFELADVFAKKIQASAPAEERYVIINPPYGVRVGNKEEINLRYYHSLIGAVIANFSPQRIGVIIPAEHAFSHRNIIFRRAFKNGGLEVIFYVLELDK